jgi:transcriptional regulator with GAF, ATPase, and Fis domain
MGAPLDEAGAPRKNPVASAKEKVPSYERWPVLCARLDGLCTDEDLVVLPVAVVVKNPGQPRPRERCQLVDGEVPLRLHDTIRWSIARALDAADGNYAEAARMLGIARSTLYRMASRYGVCCAR